MLTDAELTPMRETAALALPDEAIIETHQSVSDGGGGNTQTWTVGGTLACRIAPETQTEGEESDRLTSDQRFVVTLPFDAEVTTDSRIQIDGETYNVSGIDDRSWNITTRVHVVKEV